VAAVKPLAEYTWRCTICGREFKPRTKRAPSPACGVHEVRLVEIRILEPLVLLPEKAA
jgi:ABC-type ATPase with predicted acetyltransferase domain